MKELFFDGEQLAGFQKTSMVDYPGRLASVIFFPFCNMRCPWCHNGWLILGGKENGKDESGGALTTLNAALSHIEKRRAVLGGVVLSGGEASLYPHLSALIVFIKNLGLRVKLDVNGTLPDVLEKLFSSPESRPDYVAMDLKTAPLRYAAFMARPEPKEKIAVRIERSAALIRASGIEHEFRSLNLPAPYFTEEDRSALRPLAADSLWNFRPLVRGNCLDPSWNLPPPAPPAGLMSATR
ncbi:MAG: radical SAM protein [Spirochaetaceae bacterium]|jgi:pyruvate formate lyase activating enzyme|nr:radical SAM protein [Spirochaetaceae bacterium]